MTFVGFYNQNMPQIFYDPHGKKQRRNKEPLDENERGEWKHWFTQDLEN